MWSKRGIGRGFVEYLLEKNFKVFAGARKPKAYPTNLLRNQKLTVIQFDITDDTSIKKAVEEVNANTNTVDLLVNNAGIDKDAATGGHRELVSKLQNIDRDSINNMFDVNATSQIIVLKHFTSLMKSITSYAIHISSCRASYNDEYSNDDGNYGYRASKAALNTLTFCSLFDLPANIKTFAVHPGDVKSDMNPEGEHDPYTQAGKILDITENWREELNGRFLNFDGSFYPL